MKLSEYLRKIRTAAGYTQADIAKMLGVDRSTYAYYENGKTEPNITNLKKLANLYKITLDDLLRCRMPGTDVRLAAKEQMEPGAPESFRAQDQDAESLKSFRALAPDEKTLVMLYRSAEDQAAFIEYLRAYDGLPKGE